MGSLRCAMKLVRALHTEVRQTQMSLYSFNPVNYRSVFKGNPATTQTTTTTRASYAQGSQAVIMEIRRDESVQVFAQKKRSKKRKTAFHPVSINSNLLSLDHQRSTFTDLDTNHSVMASVSHFSYFKKGRWLCS